MQAVSIRTVWRTVTAYRWKVASGVVLAWSSYYTVALAVIHNNGPQVYGVLTAGVATAAAIGNLVLLRSPRLHAIASATVLVVWVVVAIGGIAGTIAHVVGPVPGHGAIDLRPRPIAAPLVFTLLGSVGAAALTLGQRARMRVAATSRKES